ncbi:MAG TPA: hypothetical protein PLS63_04300 [Microthrixaceae bacterium]|nr:hypothetical protein [Microthrixaceae bacterium]
MTTISAAVPDRSGWGLDAKAPIVIVMPDSRVTSAAAAATSEENAAADGWMRSTNAVGGAQPVNS